MACWIDEPTAARVLGVEPGVMQHVRQHLCRRGLARWTGSSWQYNRDGLKR